MGLYRLTNVTSNFKCWYDLNLRGAGGREVGATATLLPYDRIDYRYRGFSKSICPSPSTTIYFTYQKALTDITAREVAHSWEMWLCGVPQGCLQTSIYWLREPKQIAGRREEPKRVKFYFDVLRLKIDIT